MITPNAIANKKKHESEVNAHNWIKCSERLPGKEQGYWVTIENIETKSRYPMKLYYSKKSGFYVNNLCFIVIAWLDDSHAPEPYQGEA